MADVDRAGGDPTAAARAAVAGLVGLGIPVMILAEAAGAAGGDPLDHVSILVPPDCQAEAIDWLAEAGWSLPPASATERSLGAIAARAMWPVVRGRSRIDLHHFAVDFNRQRHDDDRFWKFSAPVLWRGVSLRTLRREHALLLALVEGVCGPVHRRAAWLDRGRRTLDGPPLEWAELLLDVRLRYLEAIVHAGLGVIASPATAVPGNVLQLLAAESTEAQRAECARCQAATVPADDEQARLDYAMALARYRRRHEFHEATRATSAPSATLSLTLPPDGATAWITIPDDKVTTEWLVLKVTADLTPGAFDGRTFLRLAFPGLPVGAVPVQPTAVGPGHRFSAMLPFHQGFLGARSIDKLGMVFVRDGLPVVWGRSVPVQIDCLMAVTGAEPSADRPAATAGPGPVSTPSATSGPRLVLCRPRNGLNDTLNQIERCWAYAERFGRQLIIDASRSGLFAAFSDYFRLRDAAAAVRLHPTADDEATFDRLSAEPAALTGRISTYAASWDARLGFCWHDGDRRVPVRFDRDRKHAAALLVHERSGGGSDSLDALRRLRFTDPVAAIIRSRVEPLGSGYVAIHLRRTDDPVDAEGYLTAVRASVAGRRVLVCTDEPAMVATARRMLSSSEVFTASTIQDANGRPQHAADAFPDPVARRRANLDALVDLVAMGRAERVLLPRSFAGRYSGYGMLAKLLCEHRDVLDGLFG